MSLSWGMERETTSTMLKMAMSEMALEKYGHLGKLINMGSYYVPVFVLVALPDGNGLTAAQEGNVRLERIKEHNKQLEKMNANKPKLYGLIKKHLSTESKDEVTHQAAYKVWHADTDPEKLWQAIERTHKSAAWVMSMR